MKRLIAVVFFGIVLMFLLGCQAKKAAETTAAEEQPLSQEEADVSDSLDDLDDLEQMDQELDEDMGFEELENLELE